MSLCILIAMNKTCLLNYFNDLYFIRLAGPELVCPSHPRPASRCLVRLMVWV